MTAVGLALSLLGPPLVAAASLRLAHASSPIAVNSLGQVALWLLAIAVIVIARRWERQPLSTIGLAWPTWRSIVSAFVTAAMLLYVATPFGVWLVGVLGLPGFDAGLARLQAQPLALLMTGGVTAGVVEELLYRGYALERLSVVTGSRAAGAALSLAAFALAHLPFWGAGSALLTAIAGAVLTMMYLWHRDLASNMAAHALTAIVQLLSVAT